MPYIKSEQRECIDGAIDNLICDLKAMPDFNENKAGILNYLVTRFCIGTTDTVSYARINELVGMLECCKLELYRRVAGIYEDKKATLNGDVYPQ